MNKRCGDCSKYLPSGADMGSGDGYCTMELDEDGIGKPVNVFEDAEKCEGFDSEATTRIRTDSTEFTYDRSFRPQRGFEEK